MQHPSPHRPQSAGQNGGYKPHFGMNGNGTSPHHKQQQQRPHSAGGAQGHQQRPFHQQNGGGFQNRPPQYPNAQQPHPQTSAGNSHHHNAQRLQQQKSAPQIRNVSIPTSQPKNVAVASAPGTGRYVAFGGVASGEAPMDIDEALSGKAVQRTIEFKRSSTSFSSSANFSGAKAVPPHFAQLQPKQPNSQQQQQNGNRPQHQQNGMHSQKQHPQQNGFAHGKPQQKGNLHPNGLPPQHKHHPNGGPAQKSPQLHANQRSPGIKPFSTASLPRNAHGIPIVHDKDPNSFRWPKRYLYPSSTVQALLQWQQFEKIGCGLSNMGNTCFLNAVLQALAYTPPLVNFLRKSEHSKECRIHKKGKLAIEEGLFCLFCALENTVKQMHSHRSHSIQPREIVSHLRSISRRFRLGRQEDSHEFLRMAMDMLQANDLSTYGGAKRIPDMRVQETTALFGIFGGYLRSQVKCLVCGYRSNTYDAFLDLSLEVSEVSSVTKALHSFTRPEKLDAENLYRCAKCQKKVRAEKHLSIFKAPTVLCIQLKRFQFQQGGFGAMGMGGMHMGMGGGMWGMMMGGGGGGGGGKITKPIQFNEKLTLEAHMSDRHSSPSYSLYAVLVHSGDTVHSGHYFSFVKSSSGQWHLMDDSSVRQVGLQHVLAQKAYMLFYVRDAIETLPIAAPSPGVSPSLGPLQTSGASAAAGAAAQEKVKQLNEALMKKKLEALALKQKQDAKRKAADSDGDSDEGDSDEGDSDSDDGSYQSDESSELSESSVDSSDEEEKSSAEDEESAAVSGDDASTSDIDMEDSESASSSSSASSSPKFHLPPRILTPYSIRLHTLQALKLFPPQAGLRRYGFPKMNRGEDAVEVEDREEEEAIHRSTETSRKRKRLLEEMEAEVADLSADEDEEVASDSDASDSGEGDEASRKHKLLVEEMMSSMPDLSDEEDDDDDSAEPNGVEEDDDEEIESDEDEELLMKKYSKEKTKEAKSSSKKDADHHDTKRAKKDSIASPSTATFAKNKPEPFWFSAEAKAAAEAAAKSGKPQEPFQFRFDLSLTPKPSTSGATTAPTTAATTAASPKPASNTAVAAPTPVPAAAHASTPTATPSKPKSTGPVILSRTPFDPRLLSREYKETQFGRSVGDWESNVASLEATREKYAMKRQQDKANAALTPQQKEKDAWDEELDKGHVRKLKNRDSLSAAGVHGETGANLFQTAQNAKNRTKDAARSGEAPEANGRGDQKKKRGAVRGLAAKGHRSHKERNAERKAGGKKNGPKGLRDF